MAATFHPQVFRGAATATPSKTERISTPSTVPVDSSPLLPLQSQSTKANHPSTSTSNAPSFGLQTDPALFPLHPSSCNPSSSEENPFRTISADDYAVLVAQHAQIRVDHRVLFPWLHGADFANSAQAANFGYVNGNREPVPRSV